MKPIARTVLQLWSMLILVATVSVSACDRNRNSLPNGPTPIERPTPFSRAITLHGTVTDQRGLPLEAASVIAYAAGMLSPLIMTTAADGSYAQVVTVSGSAGTTTLMTMQASHADYQATSRSFGVSATGADDFVITFALVAQPTTIAVGSTIADSLSAYDFGRWIGDPYDYDYAFYAKSYQMAPANADARVTLRWTGTFALQLWAIQDAPQTGQPGSEPNTISLVLKRGLAAEVIVGVPWSAGSTPPPNPVPFTLSTVAVPASARLR